VKRSICLAASGFHQARGREEGAPATQSIVWDATGVKGVEFKA
jgi:hypothetical protein